MVWSKGADTYQNGQSVHSVRMIAYGGLVYVHGGKIYPNGAVMDTLHSVDPVTGAIVFVLNGPGPVHSHGLALFKKEYMNC